MIRPLSAGNWLVAISASVALSGCLGGGGGGGGSDSSGSATATTTNLPSTSSPAIPKPTIQFRAGAASVEPNGRTQLSWTASDATQCDAFGAWSGSRTLSGEATTGALVANSPFALICSGPGGRTMASLVVMVRYTAGPLAFQRMILTDKLGSHAKAFGDIDGDGNLDPVIAAGGVLGERIVWYKHGQPVGLYASQTGGGENVKVADIDGDGAQDIVSTRGLAWYRNPRGENRDPGQDTWKRTVIDASLVAHDLVVADLNGDGRADVIARPAKKGPIRFYLQGADGRWTKHTFSSWQSPDGLGLAVADLDGDGRQDIILNGLWLRQPVEIAKVAAWEQRVVSGLYCDLPASVHVADMNGDGRPDVVFAPSLATGTYRISWYESPADPLNQQWHEHPLIEAHDVRQIRVADMNADGRPDIVFAEQASSPGKRVGILLNQGGGVNFALHVLATDGSHNIEVADTNRDGRPDLLTSNADPKAPDGGAVNFWVAVR